MPNILIVDDEPEIRKSLRGVLEDEGYKVATAESGEACLAEVRKRPFELVMLDIWLPGMDGLQTLEEMKKIVRVTKPDLTILVVDALTGNDAMEQGRVFSDAVKIDGIILAKLDADVKGGGAVSLSYVMGTPVTLVGTGQGYDDLEPFHAESIVKSMLG